jgi:LDH2 family malate/lactate/ureidoglycolate dehydrogenase
MQGFQLIMNFIVLPLFDADGNPTQDGRAAAKGGVAAFGGHKGYGLAFAIQALGLLAGAAIPRGQVQDYGFLFLVVDPGACCPGTRSRSRCPNWSRRSRRRHGDREARKSAFRRSAPSANASAAAPKTYSSVVR